MAGLTEAIDAPDRPAAALFARTPVPRARGYKAGMDRIRAATPPEEWARLLAAREARHYRSASRVHYGPPAPAAYTAWIHALEASPWLLPHPDCAALITSAYADYSDVSAFEAGLSLGARDLTCEPGAIVVHLDSTAQVVSWLQRVGPCVVEGAWTPSMFKAHRDTEVIGDRDDAEPFAHSVALVGVRPGAWPDAVRLVNNLGPAWGALGRAWMPTAQLEILLATGGEAWALIPAAPVLKRGVK